MGLFALPEHAGGVVLPGQAKEYVFREVLIQC